MSSILKKYPAFWITIGIFLLVELLVRVLPVEYAAHSEVFLTNHRRDLAEAATPEFDYIILGDSRSLSLMGHAPTGAEPYSIYNFSMPALGPRYFRFFIRKYLSNRKVKPAAIIFAGDPRHFKKEGYMPLHDPASAYTDSLDETLGSYLWNRIARRVRYVFAGGEPKLPPSAFSQEMLWQAFSHRYLHLFGPGELARQYSGPERVYILRESLPLMYKTYKFRNAIATHTIGFRPYFFKPAPEIPAKCNSCENILRDECRPEMSHIQSNQLLARGLDRRYGQSNLGDKLNLNSRMAALMVRDQMVENFKGLFNRETPDLRLLEVLIREVNAAGMKMILLDVPQIDAYKGTRFYRLYDEQVTALLKKYPLVKRVKFPEPYYPRELFIEQVHFDCAGAERLNKDFFSGVVPQILEFAPPVPGAHKRGF